MTSKKFHRQFGGPPRKPEFSDHLSVNMDLAASIQSVTEEIMLAHRPTRPSSIPVGESCDGWRCGIELRWAPDAFFGKARSRTSGYNPQRVTRVLPSALPSSSGISCLEIPRVAEAPGASDASNGSNDSDLQQGSSTGSRIFRRPDREVPWHDSSRKISLTCH